MTTQKCLVVTENPTLKGTLSKYIEDHNGLELLLWHEAVTYVQTSKSSNQIDILFLDVKRSVHSTLMVLLLYFKKINHLVWIADAEDFKKTPILRTNLYRLATPVTPQKLQELISLIIEHTVDLSPKNLHTKPKGIFIRSSEKNIGYVHCSLAEITVIEMLDRNLKIHTAERGTITTYFPITEIESKLEQEYFIRIHRSFIISKNYIDRISGNIIYMLNYNHQLKIGKKYQDSVFNFIDANTLTYK